MSQNTREIDPEKVIARYRELLEAERHRNLLLDLYASELQTEVVELRDKVAELQMEQHVKSEDFRAVEAGDTAGG